MSEAIQYLEEAEKEAQHLADLLNQADQSLERYVASINSFTSAHNKPESPTVASIKQTIDQIQGVLKDITARHNQAAGELQEAKAQATQDQQEDNPY